MARDYLEKQFCFSVPCLTILLFLQKIIDIKLDHHLPLIQRRQKQLGAGESEREGKRDGEKREREREKREREREGEEREREKRPNAKSCKKSLTKIGTTTFRIAFHRLVLPNIYVFSYLNKSVKQLCPNVIHPPGRLLSSKSYNIN